MDERERHDLDELLAGSATPVTPPPQMKSAVFERIHAVPQVTHLDAAKNRRFGFRQVTATAAAVALLAGGGIAITQQIRPSAPDGVTAAGVDEMHAIMGAGDMRQGSADAMGASLDIVVSADMGKGGAMVDGQPALDHGMGAQVWAVMADGAVKSAGVIGQEPHDNVWMPLPGETMSVMVTEEPADGMPQPTGQVLAVVKF